jgi:hypothetical protein
MQQLNFFISFIVQTMLRMGITVTSKEGAVQSHRQKEKTIGSVQEGMFGWTYKLLDWNLFARSSSISSIMLSHISWRNDSLVITFAKHKGDQSGDGLGKDKHIFANPSRPEICPILALAVYIFSTNRSSQKKGKMRLFPGGSQTSRFNKLFGKIVKLSSNILQTKASIKDLGTHSIRKGAITYVLSCLNGPSAIQVYLRAGWTIGNVQDRYIFGGAGGDQITGRLVCGLDFNSEDFAILPPHFTREDEMLMGNLGWENIVEGKGVCKILLCPSWA